MTFILFYKLFNRMKYSIPQKSVIDIKYTSLFERMKIGKNSTSHDKIICL